MPNVVAKLLARQLVGSFVYCVLVGCSGWHAQKEPLTASLVAEGKPAHVRVTLTDGRRFELWEAEVEGDSLVGLTANPHQFQYTRGPAGDLIAMPSRHAVATGEIRALDIKEFSTEKTVSAASLGLGVVAAIVLIPVLIALEIWLQGDN